LFTPKTVQQRTVGIVDDKRCELHVQTKDHQESPDRVRAIRKKLMDTGMYSRLTQIEAVEPSREDLESVHTSRYINKVFRTCTYSHGMIGSDDVRVTGNDSLISAGIAAGSVIAAVETVIKSRTVKKVFCNVRPPGHHASSHEASGFCIFNNVAIGVKKALTYPCIERVLIFDWDLHHGDGTQKIFQCNQNVMFSSFHRSAPFYPDSGHPDERGKWGTVYNYPQPKSTTVKSYMSDFYKYFLPRAIEFNPDIIFISCGFDGHKDDMYKALPLDYDDYKLMTNELCKLANKKANGRLVSVLEGGYTLNVLAESAAVHINALLNNA